MFALTWGAGILYLGLQPEHRVARALAELAPTIHGSEAAVATECIAPREGSSRMRRSAGSAPASHDERNGQALVRVFGSDGTPAAGARLAVRAQRGPEATRIFVLADAEGCVRLSIPPYEERIVSLDEPGDGSLPPFVLLTTGSSASMQVVEGLPVVSLRPRLVSSDGREILDATISVSRELHGVSMSQPLELAWKGTCDPVGLHADPRELLVFAVDAPGWVSRSLHPARVRAADFMMEGEGRSVVLALDPLEHWGCAIDAPDAPDAIHPIDATETNGIVEGTPPPGSFALIAFAGGTDADGDDQLLQR